MGASRLIAVVVSSLCAALIVGGLWLFLQGVLHRVDPTSTSATTPSELQLEAEVLGRVSRLQLLAGAGLTLLGVGGLLWQRAAHLRQGSEESNGERGR